MLGFELRGMAGGHFGNDHGNDGGWDASGVVLFAMRSR